MGRFESFWS